ncbi:MAG: hypothetical protein IT545_13265 [Rhodobacteraceae bacterium]|nr:hypothetical protein [Paracoccaceae bacterium]
MTRFAAAIAAAPVRLAGDPFARGRAQARAFPALAGAVAAAVDLRLSDPAAAVTAPATEAYTRALEAWTARHYPAILAEIEGIGAGFGIAPYRLFAYLNASHAADLAQGATLAEGCTALAAGGPAGGAIVAKNRDYRAEHVALQQVFHHEDPAWGGLGFLCVGSLGSPGNFSSGMNSAGLAVADTASRVRRHGVGMHRYFLLTWLLVHCRDVAAALEAIRALPHAGGGILVLGDAGGRVAAVELGPGHEVGIEAPAAGRAVARANHFVLPATAALNLDTPATRAANCHSEARAAALAALAGAWGEGFAAADAAAVLARHAADGAGFCRHGGADISTTISAAVWDTRARTLTLAPGNPCSAGWQRFSIAPTGRTPTEGKKDPP